MLHLDLMLDQVQRYEHALKDWKPNRQAEFVDLDGVLAVGLHLFEAACDADEEWRRVAFADPSVTPSRLREANSVLFSLFRGLHACNTLLLRRLEEAESHGVGLHRSVTFRSMAREVQGMIAPANEFFAAGPNGAKLAALKEAAIDEYRDGLTVPFGCLGD